MKNLWAREKRSKSSIAISMAIHVVVIAALATLTFHYPLADIFNKAEPLKPVAVRYVPLKPKAASAPARREATRRPTPALSLPQVSSVPVGVPAPAPPVSPATTAIGGGGDASAQASRDIGLGIGIRPGIPDGRLSTNPATVARSPQTESQQAMSALSAIYQQYLDSARAAMANPQRAPGDWSWGGKDGDKWGWDQNGIHVGGITIPNIVLAALPMNISPSMSPVDARSRDFVANDIRSHAGLMTEDEFRTAVRRVRERVDRERRERLEKAAQREKKAPPCCS